MVLEEDFPKVWEVWEGDNKRENLEKSGWSKQNQQNISHQHPQHIHYTCKHHKIIK